MKFAMKRADGGVTIVQAAPREVLEKVIGKRVGDKRVLSEADYRAHVLAKSTRPDTVEIIDLPDDWHAAHSPDKDRSFRNAWKWEGGKVDVDMPKARDIHMARLRTARDKKLEETDKLIAALDNGPVPAELRTKRQKLRDLPQTTDLSTATTPDELKAIWPDELK
jgi:hypothetical protein